MTRPSRLVQYISAYSQTFGSLTNPPGHVSGAEQTRISVLREKAAASRLGIAHDHHDDDRHGASTASPRSPLRSPRLSLPLPLTLSLSLPLPLPLPIPIPNASNSNSNGNGSNNSDSHRRCAPSAASSLPANGSGIGIGDSRNGSTPALADGQGMVMKRAAAGGTEGVRRTAVSVNDVLLFGVGGSSGSGGGGKQTTTTTSCSSSSSSPSSLVSPLDPDTDTELDLDFDLQLGSPVSPLSPPTPCSFPAGAAGERRREVVSVGVGV